ncbi:hypothetical protein BDP81DRAFT_83965 [Colletotrichum phormii]|uniref:Uncharacterized protein n=1 Tax=Colletotrichum phormii TaxID=359342 RepID=A0AAJ0EIS1_9PEZI|nr:uncharacterized protein BDP81DRAFT_83965 [Colletotrichum phormii]KAK1654480.1 hypothetical protein BDP81DRAFT_83965 [Colletotrichum phormii]
MTALRAAPFIESFEESWFAILVGDAGVSGNLNSEVEYLHKSMAFSIPLFLGEFEVTQCLTVTSATRHFIQKMTFVALGTLMSNPRPHKGRDFNVASPLNSWRNLARNSRQRGLGRRAPDEHQTSEPNAVKRARLPRNRDELRQRNFLQTCNRIVASDMGSEKVS